jgi:hypothetical protein
MARRFEKLYKFDPVAGTLKIPGHIELEDLLLVVNTTRNVIIYNFSDPSKGATWEHDHLGDEDYPEAIDGTCTFNFFADTSGMSAEDRLQVVVEDQRRGIISRPPEFGLDSIERQRVSSPEALIDADFEYGIQLTKWDNLGLNRNIPSFYEFPKPTQDINNIVSNGVSPFSLITVTYNAGVASTDVPVTGGVISVRGTGNPLADGLFIVESGDSVTAKTSSYRAKGVISVGSSLLNNYTQAKEGGIFERGVLPVTSYQTGATSGIVTVTFSGFHGLVPGSPILVADNRAGRQTHEGRFYVRQVVDGRSINYDSGNTLTDVPNTTNTAVYAINDSFFEHAPFDGGVKTGSLLPVHGLEAKRQTKRYFRYQAGKGILFSTGALLAPSFDVDDLEIINNKTQIKITTSDFHGLQTGAGIKLIGISTTASGDSSLINKYYTVSGITSEKAIIVDAAAGIAGTSIVTVDSKVGITTWAGAAVRLGIFDDFNGMYWEFDGQKIYIAKRSSTYQLSGFASMNVGSTEIFGIGTKFADQLIVGDSLQIKGQRYQVVGISSNTTCHVSPPYRGASFSGSKICLIQDKRVPQEDFNFDTINGKGPSHFNLKTDGDAFRKMQMFGIQYSWYGAGYIDYAIRGPLGEWIIAHRIANNNKNTEAYMRSGNLPARYEVSHNTARSKLTNQTGFTTTTLNLKDANEFPTPLPGYPEYVEVTSKQTISGSDNYIHEIMSYTGKSGNTLTGVTTSTNYSIFLSGSERTFYGPGGIAEAGKRLQSWNHPEHSSVILINTTCAPTITHWGSSVIMDGGFDGDPTIQFSLTRNTIDVAGGAQVLVGVLRPAPSVSDTLIGNLGERELINRSLIKFGNLYVSSKLGTGNIQPTTIEVIGILNSTGYENTSWISANRVTIGTNNYYQPSFVQYSTTETLIPRDGEILFRFQLRSDESKIFDLTGIKELQNSILGGNRTYPDGPEVLAVVINNPDGGASDNAIVDISLSWTEAQA